MHPRSDLYKLFAKQSHHTGHYQEISARARLEAHSTRWALLQEIHRANQSVLREPSRQK